jgi:hypothetical protein
LGSALTQYRAGGGDEADCAGLWILRNILDRTVDGRGGNEAGYGGEPDGEREELGPLMGGIGPTARDHET